jgi:hypothetical protein
MGCAIIRLSVPLFYSELIASNPSVMPSKGPRKPMKTMKEGSVPSDKVNKFRKRNELLNPCDSATLLMFVREEYNEPKHVSAIIVIKRINLQLLMWSEISLLTITGNGWVLFAVLSDFVIDSFMISASFKITVINLIKAKSFLVQD